MARTSRNFTQADYEGDYNLLKAEKNLILRSLIRHNGNLEKAYRALCPNGKYIYDYRTFLIRTKRHNIDVTVDKPNFNKEYDSIAQEKVQERLRKLADREHITLRSLMK